MISVEVGTMPWDVTTVPGVTSSENAVDTVEWRARQENRGHRRYKPQRKHDDAPAPRPEPAKAQTDDDEPPHRLNVLA